MESRKIVRPWDDPACKPETIPPPPGTEDVVFTSKYDGSEQRYLLVPPNGILPAGPVDVLFTFHGHGADRWQFVVENKWERRATRDFANAHGMLLVAPDYRAPASWMGPAAEADVLQIVDDLKSRFQVRRVFFSGASMGGTATLTLGALHPGLAAGLVAMNPLADHVSYVNFQDAIEASFGGSKTEKFEEYRKRSALYYPERFTVPVSITVSGLDEAVPPESATLLAMAIHELRPDLVFFESCPWRIHMTDYEGALRAFEEMLARADRLAQEEAAGHA